MVKPRQLGHLVIRVRDLDSSERWYTEALGLQTMKRYPGRMTFMSARDDRTHELALMRVGEDAPGPDNHRVGLAHFAWEMDSFEELQELYEHLRAKNVEIRGIGDHGLSLGVYIADPDGNEIEVYYELPFEEWPEEGVMFQGEFPGKLEREEVAV